MFDQAMTTNDQVIRSAMLEPIADDGTAGAALLRIAPEVVNAKRREAGLQGANNSRQRERAGKEALYRAIADAIQSKNPSLRCESIAQLVREKLLADQKSAPSVKTISRALKPKAETARE
jgi:hypothetical protein